MSIDYRPYQEGDEDAIRALFSEVFGREMSPQEWRWKYPERGAGKVYAVVGVAEDGTLAGHYGGTPFDMVYHGKIIRGMLLGDVMIRPRYRGIRTFRRLTHAMEEFMYREGLLMVYGFPNEQTLMLPSEKLGLYDRVEDVFDFWKDAVLLSSSDRLKYKLFPMDFGDAATDLLWRRIENEMGLAIVRNREFLQWRYERHPFYRYELWGMRRRWERSLLGAAVIRREPPDTLLIIDVLCPRRYLGALLSKTENMAAASGAKKVRLWLPSFLHHVAARRGFQRGACVTTIPCTTRPGFLTAKEIRDVFFYTMGDTDFL